MSRPVRYKCICGSVIEVTSDYINNQMPPICPVCLHATWLVRSPGGKLVALGASPDADEWLGLLNAQSARAQQVAKEIEEDMKQRAKLEWN